MLILKSVDGICSHCGHYITIHGYLSSNGYLEEYTDISGVIQCNHVVRRERHDPRGEPVCSCLGMYTPRALNT